LGAAEVQFTETLRTAPINAKGEAYVQLIHVLSMNRKTGTLAKLCEDALERPDIIRLYPLLVPLFHSHLSFAYARLGKDAEAIASADKAIAQSGDHRLGYHLSKVRLLSYLGRHEEAVALATKLLQEFPGPAERLQIRYQLSSAYTAAKKDADAEREL